MSYYDKKRQLLQSSQFFRDTQNILEWIQRYNPSSILPPKSFDLAVLILSTWKKLRALEKNVDFYSPGDIYKHYCILFVFLYKASLLFSLEICNSIVLSSVYWVKSFSHSDNKRGCFWLQFSYVQPTLVFFANGILLVFYHYAKGKFFDDVGDATLLSPLLQNLVWESRKSSDNRSAIFMSNLKNCEFLDNCERPRGKTEATKIRSSGTSKRVRTIFSPSQLERLEQEFKLQQYMVGSERSQLAHSLRLAESQVCTFQNFCKFPINFSTQQHYSRKFSNLFYTGTGIKAFVQSSFQSTWLFPWHRVALEIELQNICFVLGIIVYLFFCIRTK